MKSMHTTYRFNLKRAQYQRTRILGAIFCGVLVFVASIGIFLGLLLWKTYTHGFTPYLKWQDALLSLSWFIAFVALGGCVMIIRFLHALHSGVTHGMVLLNEDRTITVRDLSSENLKSIFWIMNSAFWCFVAALVGLFPAILVGWTLHIQNPVLMIVTTGIAILLSLAGLIVSVISVFFIVVGCIGIVTFCRKLGSSHTYTLNSQVMLRIDNFVLMISYPSERESLVDLNLLSLEDQRRLLFLIHERWLDHRQFWSPELGEEIAVALETAQRSPALV